MGGIRGIIRRRTTCRNFSGQTLSREKVGGLINDAVWVPNGSNSQPWRFVVITDRARMKAFSDAAKQNWLDNFSVSPHIQQYEKAIRDPEFNIFYNAPALIIVYGNSDSYWHVYDCSMVALNLHLLAEEDGLGCCWVGFAHNIFSDPAVMHELGVPQQYRLVAPLILGHPADIKSGPENPNKRKPFEITFLT